MIADKKFSQVVRELIARRCEGVHWDFKREHHTANGDLIHDVLCLANAKHAGRRFLIFGVDDNNFSLHDIKNSSGRRTQADIAGLFRDNASKFFQSRFPTFHLRETEIDGTTIDVLVIEDEPNKPYFLAEKIAKVKAHHLYTRVCDTNTPVDKSAQPHEIERMWRERFGLDAPALDRARRYLGDQSAWTERYEGGDIILYHNVFPEFTLRATSSETSLCCNHEWTRGEIRSDNNNAGWYELRFHQTILCRIHHVIFDDRKKSMVAPDCRPVGQGLFYFYRIDSIEYAVQNFWTKRWEKDDSKGLRIRGDGAVAREARLKWPNGLSIPIVDPEQLEGFLESRQTDPSHEVASDRNNQYELFLHAQLDFDTWRQKWVAGVR